MYIDQKTKLIGLLGYPLDHSLSPLMHNTAFQAMKLNYIYIPLPVTPGRLRDAVLGLKALNFVGANVTLPHKEEIIPYLDFITEEAKLVGAVNTLFWTEDGYLVGDNTDVEGFKRTTRDFDIDILGRTAVVLGCGGAARAVAVCLARLEAKEIIFLARRQEKVYQVIQELQGLFPKTLWSSHIRTNAMFASDLGRTSLLVNASPAGMYPRVEDAALSLQLLALLPNGSHVYDLVYNPPETKLLKLAKELETLKQHMGLEMLVQQGAVAFERWTGKTPPVPVMQNILKRHILHMQGGNLPQQASGSIRAAIPSAPWPTPDAPEETPGSEPVPQKVTRPKGKNFDATI